MTLKDKAIDAAERALNTFAQGFLTALGGEALNVWSADWKAALGLGAGAALLSVLKSLSVFSLREKPEA